MAGGILSSRVFGLVRESTVAYVFGVGGHADVLGAAMRGPNLLQNLLGEQTLSASFIPAYSKLLGEGRFRDAGRLAGAMFGLLCAASAALALIGIALAPQVVAIMMPGFLGDTQKVAAGISTIDRYPLAVTAVRILFPMTGFLVLSAWALGVLNSHRRFFLPYFAPVVWNAAIIGALLFGAFGWTDGPERGTADLDRLLVLVCWAALAGGLLQFLIQLPTVLRISEGLRVSFSTRVAGVRDTLRALGPMLGARGAAQLSAYLDQVLASFLAVGAITGLRYGSILYLLPFALFAGSVAAAELPELSRGALSKDPEALVRRARRALRQIAFLIVPTVVGYLAFGYLIVGCIYRRGRFGAEENWLVFAILAGYSLGLLASAWSRLLQNLYYAHGNTRVPAATAVLRMVVSAGVGVTLMLWLDRFGVQSLSSSAPTGDLRLGGVGLALASAVAAWLEFGVLRWRSRGSVAPFALPWDALLRMVLLAVAALVPGLGLWFLLSDLPPWMSAPAVTGVFVATYLGVSRWLGWTELSLWLGRLGAGNEEPTDLTDGRK